MTIAGSPGLAGHLDGTGAGARFDSLAGLAVLGEDVYVGDNGSLPAWVRRVSMSTRAVTTVHSYRGAEDDPTFVGGLATRGKVLYVAETGRSILHRLNPTTSVDVVVERPFGGSDQPAGVAVDGTTVAYTDVAYQHQNIRSLDVPTGTWVSAGGWAETGIADGTGATARFSGLGGLVAIRQRALHGRF